MHENSRGTVRVEPSAKRVRAYLAGRLVVDTRHPALVWEAPYYPTYYVPLADVAAELAPTGKTEHSPSRGDAEILDVRVDGTVAESAAKCYPDSPLEAIAAWSGSSGLRWTSGSKRTSPSTPTHATRTTAWTSWPAPVTSASRWTA